MKGGMHGMSPFSLGWYREDAGTLEEVYEPYLIKNGYLNRTPRGRAVTALAYQRLGLPAPEQA